MRKIDKIIIHCTATPTGRDHSAAEIAAWHRRRGFSTIGYHYIIRIDGTIEVGRPPEQPGAHCRGYNLHSVGIAYVGGTDGTGHPCDTRTEAQKAALKELVGELRMRFPEATVHGHGEFAPKACPCFDVVGEFSAFQDPACPKS